MSAPKIIVGTGWWSAARPHDWTLGSEKARLPDFFSIWYRLIRKYLDPERVIVTDSRSPLKPPTTWEGSDLQWLELDRNYGHANDIRTGRIHARHSGFTRSMYVGATYAMACDADYFVYVEQDCVIHGEGFLEAITEGMEHPIAVGAPTQGGVGISGPAAPMLQQSLVVVRADGLERFVTTILSAPETDGELAPELKFERYLRPFSLLPVPFGRSRPLDFSRSHFYAQHLTDDELSRFLELEGIPADEGARPALRFPSRVAEAIDLDERCVRRPVLREIVAVWRRRGDLQTAFPEVARGQLGGLLRWSLLSGINEDPVLFELAAEVANEAGEQLQSTASWQLPRPPRKVHLVSLAGSFESFDNCAEALHQGLVRARVPVEHHRDVDADALREFAEMPPDEVVHVTGQGRLGPLLRASATNWVLTIHGAAPYSMPPDLHPPPGEDLGELRDLAGSIPRVICPSFAARREIAIAYGIARDLIEPVPHFFDQNTFTVDGPRYSDGRYFLAVSSYQPKKNYAAVIEAFRQLVAKQSADPVRLLFAGETNRLLLDLVQDSLARSPDLAGRLVLLGHVPNLAPYYRGALALVSMAHQEGFGMPYIEAALCGVPVVGPLRSSRVAAWASQPTRELLGAAGLYVDPDRPQDLATVMQILASDESTRVAIAGRCRDRARWYVDPEFLTRRYLYVYGSVLERSRA